MTAAVELERLTVRFGDFTAVRDVSLRIEAGEFFSFLGPSGCGKTTILRAISGFLEPSAGLVRIGGQDMSGIGPNRRPTALIFQNLALFPLMSVAENIAYGLRVRGVSKAERRRRAESLLALTALSGQGDKRINELSGGQRQRVAIARALAVEPKVLLLDEPLSALDLKLRQHMRAELRAIQRRTGLTFIYITHDQSEALGMSDRIAVMNEGVIQQVGDGKSLYKDPATAFVASFVGENNPFEGLITRSSDSDLAMIQTSMAPLVGCNPHHLPAGTEAVAFIRPEALSLSSEEGNAIPALVKSIVFEGSQSHVYLAGPGPKDIVVTVNRTAALPQPGESVLLRAAIADTLILPKGKLASE